MSKKRLNTAGVLSELSGQSVFFSKNERNSGRSENRTEKRAPEHPIRRRTKRYSFEFYEDQLTRLKQIKYQAEMRGDHLFMSQIVRQALDEYFAQHATARESARNSVRTAERTE